MQKVSRVFSRFGFGQLAGMAAIWLSSLAMRPFVTPEKLKELLGIVGPSALLLSIYIPNLFFLLAFWLVVRGIPKAGWQKERMSPASLLKAFAMMYAVTMVLSGIGSAVSGGIAPAGTDGQTAILDQVVGTGLLTGFLLPAVLAPVVEELIFRKMMIDRLHNYGETTVIVFTALCFALYHGNLTQAVYTFGVGLFLGYVYCKTGRMLHTLLMHVALNTLASSVLLLLPTLTAAGEGGADRLILAAGGLGLLIAVLIVAGIVLLIRRFKRRDIVLDDSMAGAVPKGEVLRTVYLNPGVLLFILLSVGLIAADLLEITAPF